MPSSETRVLILAGGASRRMGSDKAASKLGAHTLLERACACALGTGYPVALAGGERPVDRLPSVIERCADGCGKGPVAGILGAACRWPGSSWLLIACDLPLLTTGFLRRLVLLADSHPGVCAVVPKTGERLHPLSAWYGPPMIELLRQRALEGSFGLTEALMSRPSIDAARPGEAPVLLADAGRMGKGEAELQEQLLNCNRPADLARAREVLRRRTSPLSSPHADE